MNIKVFPPEIQELEFTTPSNRPQLSRRDYLNYDQVTNVSGDNPDMLEFGRIKCRLKFVQNFSTPKLLANTKNPLNNSPGFYLITEILECFYWKGILKDEALKKIRNCKKLITLVKFRNCV